MASHALTAPPTDVGLDSDLGNLEAESTPQTSCALEAFLLCGKATYPRSARVGGTCQSNTHMEGRTQRFLAKHHPKYHTGSSGSPCILVLICSLVKTPTQTTIHVMEKKSRQASSSAPQSDSDVHQPTVGQSNSKSIDTPLYPTLSTYISSYSLHTGLPDERIQ